MQIFAPATVPREIMIFKTIRAESCTASDLFTLKANANVTSTSMLGEWKQLQPRTKITQGLAAFCDLKVPHKELRPPRRMSPGRVLGASWADEGRF